MRTAPATATSPSQVALTAETYLAALKACGIDYLFANAGTDFPPIIEAFARAGADSPGVPRPLLVPHEHVAVGMAHGYYVVTGRPQAVMLHVNVGTANGICALINAYRDDIPLLFTAGRTPITEDGPAGTRNRPIHWAQEMFDQAGMVRECVKWDHELHAGERASDVVTRALEVAMTAPRGPVYLTLPREVLAAPAVDAGRAVRAWAVPAPAAPNPDAVETVAGWIAAARMPLVIAAGVGRSAGAVAALAQLAERFAVPVVTFNPRYMCLPASHPMHLGYAPRPLLAEADIVVVLDSDVPWFPSLEAPPAGARIVHIADDPIFARYPIRSFPSDLSIAADPALSLAAIADALERRGAQTAPAVAERRRRLAAQSAKLRAGWAAEAESAGREPEITPAWISRCLAAVKDDDTLVFNEYHLRLEHCAFERPGSYFGLSPAGGLGWSICAALGAKLAAPERLVIATIGDGSYMFANPTACHWVADAHRLPILTIVFNNALWGAVRNATLTMYGQGAAAQERGRLLADLRPCPAYEKLIEAQGGFGERVEQPAALPATLARAVAAVREGHQALLNVVCRS
ncbi:MAG: thiamine pyrophosphate-requiring protein [Proteobacteria bacterium]|nr:thiamine pyrophosphate-requiring protein [Pseudomonadota bacterium]